MSKSEVGFKLVHISSSGASSHQVRMVSHNNNTVYSDGNFQPAFSLVWKNPSFVVFLFTSPPETAALIWTTAEDIKQRQDANAERMCRLSWEQNNSRFLHICIMTTWPLAAHFYLYSASKYVVNEQVHLRRVASSALHHREKRSTEHLKAPEVHTLLFLNQSLG